MLNGKPMENGRQFDVNLYRLAAGDIAALEVLRGSSRVKVDVAIAEREGDPTRLVKAENDRPDFVIARQHMARHVRFIQAESQGSHLIEEDLQFIQRRSETLLMKLTDSRN